MAKLSHKDIAQRIRNRKYNINTDSLLDEAVCGRQQGSLKTVETIANLIESAPLDIHMPVRVKFNDPATILWWDDGEKTVAKCHECNVCVLNSHERDKINFYDGINHGLECARNGLECARKKNDQTGIMAAMLKRYYPNLMNVIRKIDIDD